MTPTPHAYIIHAILPVCEGHRFDVRFLLFRADLSIKEIIEFLATFDRSNKPTRSCATARLRRSMSASTVIPDRFTFGIVISGVKTVQFEMALARKAIAFRQTFSLAGRERVKEPYV